jgi:tetratricopeptide (TPR) repeat protein
MFIWGNSKPGWPLYKRIGFYLLTYVLAGFAIFTKETLLMLAAIIPLYDLCFMRTGSWAPFKQRLYFFYLPLPVLGGIAIALSPNLVAVGMEWLAKAQPGYALQQLSVIPYAAKLVLFPINLVFDYDFAQADFSTGLGRVLGGGLIVLVVFAAWVVLYRVYPLAAFCTGWFLLLLVPTNSFLPRMDLLSERNLYLPSIGLLLLVVTLAFRFFTSLHRPDIHKVALGGLILLLALNAGLVVKRNQAYRSNIALWEDTYKKSPGKARVYHNLSHFYIEAGDFEKAFVMLKKLAGSKTTPYYRSYAHTHLGNIYVRFGRMNLAKQEFNEALRLDPDIPTGYYNLGVLYATREQHAEALKFLKQAEEAQSRFDKGQLLPPTLDLYLGKSYFHLAQYDLARQRVERFLASNPESSPGHLLLGHIFHNQGQPEKATQAYRKVKGTPGLQAQAHQSLAELMLKQNQLEDAIKEYEKAVSLHPEVLETRYQLGRLLLATGQNEEKAKQHLEYALKLSPPPHRLVEIEGLLEKLD